MAFQTPARPPARSVGARAVTEPGERALRKARTQSISDSAAVVLDAQGGEGR
jgi:hypothetical protein